MRLWNTIKFRADAINSCIETGNVETFLKTSKMESRFNYQSNFYNSIKNIF